MSAPEKSRHQSEMENINDVHMEGERLVTFMAVLVHLS